MDDRLATLQTRLGRRFNDARLLERALTHRSFGADHNERLEFLGDAILGLVVTDHLYRTAADMSEGVLARHRSELVSAAALAEVARSVELGAALSLGKGEEATGGRDKTSILADGMEAVIGGVYLDGGIGAATTLVLHLLDARIDEVLYGGLASDHKSRLQEYAARRFGQLPRYVLTEDGPEHEKRFSARVELDGTSWGEGEGRTKKEAEQAAARTAVTRLHQEPEAGSADGGSAAASTDAAAGEEGTTPEPAGTTRGGNHA